jgi:phosphatidylserine decarboxylase
MNFGILISSLAVSIIVFVLLCAKCRISMRTGLWGGIFAGLGIGILLQGIALVTGPKGWLWWIPAEGAGVLGLGAGIALWRFYRDPERRSPENGNIVLSPADGIVRYIVPVRKGEIPFSIKGRKRFPLTELVRTDLRSEDGWLIGIEMNLLDVHVNRAPVEGRIVFQKRIPGKFTSLRDLSAILDNERVTTVFDNGTFQTAMVQIASRMVRRIDSYKREGDEVQFGQRVGMIKMGSQVDVVIPKLEHLRFHVQPGDRVKAGESVLLDYSIKSEKSTCP